MISFIAFLLPLILGVLLSILIGKRTNRALKETFDRNERLLPVAVKYTASAVVAVVALSFVLAAIFADVTDTLDGNASREQFVGYAKFQAICMSVFLMPTMLMALLLGRKGE